MDRSRRLLPGGSGTGGRSAGRGESSAPRTRVKSEASFHLAARCGGNPACVCGADSSGPARRWFAGAEGRRTVSSSARRAGPDETRRPGPGLPRTGRSGPGIRAGPKMRPLDEPDPFLNRILSVPRPDRRRAFKRDLAIGPALALHGLVLAAVLIAPFLVLGWKARSS